MTTDNSPILEAESLEALGTIMWGVIITWDFGSGENAKSLLTPAHTRFKRLLRKTEGNEQAYGHPYPRHQKWVGCLEQKDFDELVKQQMLHASRCETMGALGMATPDGGMCFGHLPAISFDADRYAALVNAYVTPFVMTDAERELSKEGWQHLRELVLKKYGNRP